MDVAFKKTISKLNVKDSVYFCWGNWSEMILLFVLFLATDVSAGLYCWLPCDDGVTICDGVAPRLWPDVQMILGQWRRRGEHNPCF